VLFSTYSDDGKPEFELVDVIVLVDRSMIGALALGLVLLTAPAAETDVVNVGDGELDDVL
jgi:hypothetical protein